MLLTSALVLTIARAWSSIDRDVNILRYPIGFRDVSAQSYKAQLHCLCTLSSLLCILLLSLSGDNTKALQFMALCIVMHPTASVTTVSLCRIYLPFNIALTLKRLVIVLIVIMIIGCGGCSLIFPRSPHHGHDYLSPSLHWPCWVFYVGSLSNLRLV